MNTIENAKEIISSYKRDDGKKLRIMEVCGTHTHEIFRLGIRKLLPESVELISCLLYTSPSPRDRQKSRMPSSA